MRAMYDSPESSEGTEVNIATWMPETSGLELVMLIIGNAQL